MRLGCIRRVSMGADRSGKLLVGLDPASIRSSPPIEPSNPRAAVSVASRTPWYGHLYVQVLVAIALGAGVGYVAPGWGKELEPLGRAFINLIRMLIAPVIFGTVVVGIARVGDLREVGRVGLKALVYFEVVSSLALVIGLVVVNAVRPGAGINADVRTLDVGSLARYRAGAESLTVVGHLLNLIPESVVGAFARGEILPVLLFSVLFGLGLTRLGDEARPIVDLLDRLTHALFATIGIIMRVAPIGAFGAMAFTVGAFGVGSLAMLGKLLLCFYATCLVFVFAVLGTIARLAGFGIVRFLAYIREEILIVLGTSSSESALPRLITKLEDLGCARRVVGLVVPTGYSFNLDGTSIYLTLAAVFVAQATNVPLTWEQQLAMLAVLLLTSKGAAAVTGGGFITLIATLETTHTVPVAGLTLLVGVDRFMSEARAITNLIGNGVATIVVARWDGALDRERMNRVLAAPHAVQEARVETPGPDLDPAA